MQKHCDITAMSLSNYTHHRITSWTLTSVESMNSGL